MGQPARLTTMNLFDCQKSSTEPCCAQRGLSDGVKDSVLVEERNVTRIEAIPVIRLRTDNEQLRPIRVFELVAELHEHIADSDVLNVCRKRLLLIVVETRFDVGLGVVDAFAERADEVNILGTRLGRSGRGYRSISDPHAEGIALFDRTYKVCINSTLQARALLDYELGKQIVLIDPPMLVAPDAFTHTEIMKAANKQAEIFARCKQAAKQKKSFYDCIKKQKQIDAILCIMSLSPAEAQKVPHGRRHFIFFQKPSEVLKQFKYDYFCNKIMFQLLKSFELQNLEAYLSKLFITKYQLRADIIGEIPQISVTIDCPPDCLFLQKFLKKFTGHYKAFDYLRKVIMPEVVTYGLMDYINYEYSDIYRISWPEEPYK